MIVLLLIFTVILLSVLKKRKLSSDFKSKKSGRNITVNNVKYDPVSSFIKKNNISYG